MINDEWQDADNEELVADVPVSPALRVVREGDGDIDDEAIEWSEVQRLIYERDWGPILALPVSDEDCFSWRQTDGDSGLDTSAFCTHDFARMYGDGLARRRRYAVSQAKREYQERLWAFEMVWDRIKHPGKATVLRLVVQGVLSKEHCIDNDMYDAARLYLRVLDAMDKVRRIKGAGRGTSCVNHSGHGQ